MTAPEVIDHDAAFCCGPGEEFIRASANQRAAEAYGQGRDDEADGKPLPNWVEDAFCGKCGHRLGDHDERDGCGGCAMAMAGACHPRWPWW
jgi:hypothetical protein